MVPSSGIETWKSDSSSSRNASNSSSARSISSISSTGAFGRRIAASKGRSSRYFSENTWSSMLSAAAMRLDRQQLPLVIPLVERGGLIEALVALQPDQLGRVHFCKRLRHFRLADARLAFEQQRTPQQLHQRDRGREVRIGDIARCGQGLRDSSRMPHSVIRAKPHSELRGLAAHRSPITPPRPDPSPPSSCARNHAASGCACCPGTRTRR